MKISVIIPHFNRKGLLLKCLDSIAENDYSQDNYEVIVVDDCSPCDVSEIYNYSKIKNFSFYKLSVNSGGASVPRNTGINFAIGKYILFIDSDDTISKGFLSRMIAIAEEGDCDAVRGKIITKRTTAAWMQDLHTDVIHLYHDDTSELSDFTFGDCYIIAKIYRTEIIKKFGIRFPEKLKRREDTCFAKWFWLVSQKTGICASEQYFLADAEDGNLSRSNWGAKDAYECIYFMTNTIGSIPDELAPIEKKARIYNGRMKHKAIQMLLESPFYLSLLNEECSKYFHAVKHLPQIRGTSRTLMNTILQKMITFSKYIQHLTKYKQNYLIIFSSKDTPGTTPAGSMSPLKLMDLQHHRLSYAAVINDGKVLFEKISTRPLDPNDFISYDNTIDGNTISVVSKGIKIGNIASIKINEIDYSANRRGLNIVVYDKINKKYIESVNFDTWLKV